MSTHAAKMLDMPTQPNKAPLADAQPLAASASDASETLTADLASHLTVLGFDDEWRVVEVFKTSDTEITELVVPAPTAGGTSPTLDNPDVATVSTSAEHLFVRKRIDDRTGLGSAYEQLLVAQSTGVSFNYLPRIISCNHVAGRLDVVMEYVDGETLESYVEHHGSSPEVVRSLFPQLCAAVSELHGGLGIGASPLIHRDLKPSNIMVSSTPDGGLSVKLIDLGIARRWRDGADSDTIHLGTRAYAPPEQYGFGQTSVCSDVYALGGLLLFCLTGSDPTPGTPIDQQVCRAEVPEVLGRVICRAMALDPQVRYQSAQALSEAVQAALVHPAMPAVLPDEASNKKILRPSHLLNLIPRWTGHIWNAVVLALLALCIAGSVQAILHPTGKNASTPVWLLVIDYLCMVDVWLVVIAYALLDKRWLRKRFAVLDRWRG